MTTTASRASRTSGTLDAAVVAYLRAAMDDPWARETAAAAPPLTEAVRTKIALILRR
jgi:hypothetical protein